MEQIKVLEKLHRISELISEKDKEAHPWEQLPDPILAEKLEKLHLSHSGRKLLVVLKKEGSCNQRNLALKLGISPQAVSETVKKLEFHGCIQKTNGNQKNENLISLTTLGDEFAQFLKQIIYDHANMVFSSFSQEEVSLLGDLLEKLLLQIQDNSSLEKI